MKYLLLLLTFITSTIVAQEFKYNLCVCAIFQNESPYMKEWIEYHLKEGVDHFYLYNNDSTDDYLSVLDDYIRDGRVTLIDWSNRKNDWVGFAFDTQPSAYNDAITKLRMSTKWLAIIDIDEFIIPVCEKTIVEILDKYFFYCSGICINWQCYGTSDIWEVAQEKMLEELVWKMKWDDPWNKNCKSIVNPRHVEHCPNPHFCLYNDGHWGVDTNGNRASEGCTMVNIDKLRINHYWPRDKKYLYENKIPRYKKWNSSSDIQGLIDLSDLMNYEFDDLINQRV